MTESNLPQNHCTVQGCEKRILAKGLCNSHYQRQKRESMAPLSFADLAKLRTDFWKSVNKTTNDACWPYVGSFDRDGYGRVSCSYRSLRAHRIAYALTHGLFPDDLVVRHSCDNPPCCNPAHLVLGKNVDNVQDKVERDRQAKGERIGRAVLTETQVREIKMLIAQKVRLRRIGKMFNVHEGVISKIKRGKSWGWV